MHCFNNVADGFARILLRTRGMIAEPFMETQGKCQQQRFTAEFEMIRPIP